MIHLPPKLQERTNSKATTTKTTDPNTMPPKRKFSGSGSNYLNLEVLDLGQAPDPVLPPKRPRTAESIWPWLGTTPKHYPTGSEIFLATLAMAKEYKGTKTINYGVLLDKCIVLVEF